MDPHHAGAAWIDDEQPILLAFRPVKPNHIKRGAFTGRRAVAAGPHLGPVARFVIRA